MHGKQFFFRKSYYSFSFIKTIKMVVSLRLNTDNADRLRYFQKKRKNTGLQAWNATNHASKPIAKLDYNWICS